MFLLNGARRLVMASQDEKDDQPFGVVVRFVHLLRLMGHASVSVVIDAAGAAGSRPGGAGSRTTALQAALVKRPAERQFCRLLRVLLHRKRGQHWAGYAEKVRGSGKC